MNEGRTPEDREEVVNKKGMRIEIPFRTINPIIPQAINPLILLFDSLLLKLEDPSYLFQLE